MFSVLWFQFSFVILPRLCLVKPPSLCLEFCHFLFYFLVFVLCVLCFSFAYLVSSSLCVAIYPFPHLHSFIASRCPVHVFIVLSSFVLVLWTPCVCIGSTVLRKFSGSSQFASSQSFVFCFCS